MLKNPFTEDFAASKSKRQQLDHLLRVTAPHEHFILAGIGLLLLACVVWALFGSVTRSVVLDGILLETGARHEVVTAEPGYLLEFLVMPGARVAAGEPVARQSVPGLERELAALHKRIGLLEEEIRQATVVNRAQRQLLVSARTTLLELEARRDARQLITSQIGGALATLRASPGDYLPGGASVALVREADNQPLQAALHVPPELARDLRAPAPASVELALPGGATRWLEGEIIAVSAEPFPRWLQELLPAAAGSGYRVDISLRQTEELSVPDGTPCRVRIILGRRAPAALLDLGRARINPLRTEA